MLIPAFAPVLSVAASLSFKDAFLVPLGKEKMVDKIKEDFGTNHFCAVNLNKDKLFIGAMQLKNRERERDRQMNYQTSNYNMLII